MGKEVRFVEISFNDWNVQLGEYIQLLQPDSGDFLHGQYLVSSSGVQLLKIESDMRTCDNHLTPIEYPAETSACEVCGRKL